MMPSLFDSLTKFGFHVCGLFPSVIGNSRSWTMLLLSLLLLII